MPAQSSPFKFSSLALYQCIAGLLVAFILLLIHPAYGFSCLAGVVLTVIANTFMMLWFFLRKTQDPTVILMRLYSGEIGKWIILALGIFIIAKSISLVWWAFIIGIAVVQLSYCIIPYLMCKQGTVGL